MAKGKVFVVQMGRKIDPETGEAVDKFDLTPAKRWGELVPVVSPAAKPFDADKLIEKMYYVLDGFNDNDYILPVGNVSIISMTVAVASQLNSGKVKLLQWDAKSHTHVPVICHFP